jgi:G protein-coupled receptor GPR1
MALVLDRQSAAGTVGVLDASSDFSVRGLGASKAGSVGKLSPVQNRAILIVAVTTACISLTVAIVSLRFFLSMKRSFRHHLILMLIISDSFKAMWYFVSPVVIFSCGEIQSSSHFSQASGFLLAMGIEGADLSILFIALHTTLYIFRPPQRFGNGGLYGYRHWVYGMWITLPILAASLAFTNRSGPAYVTAGTFSYLPKRPFWYRLALAWIPRYLIFTSIIGMYLAIYIYVKVKFKDFHSFESDEFSFDPSSMQASRFDETSHNPSSASPQATMTGHGLTQGGASRRPSIPPTCNSPIGPSNSRKQSLIPEDIPEWERIDFITKSPVVSPQRISELSLGIHAADFAREPGTRSNSVVDDHKCSVPRKTDSTLSATRNNSTEPTFNTNFTSDTVVTAGTGQSSPSTLRSSPHLRQSGATDQLTITRIAIRRQLRFLFIYPLVYLTLWTLPFIQHCLNYTDYYTAHPQFWLNICTVCILGLQAGIDCAIFSWREKPWHKMHRPPILSVWAFQKLKTRFWAKDEGAALSDGSTDMRGSGDTEEHEERFELVGRGGDEEEG